MPFEAFPKIGRLARNMVVTEKIDGTNAQIEIIFSAGTVDGNTIGWRPVEGGAEYMYAGSRSRYVTPGNDNFGFARWAQEHVDELWQLGPGRHYGEWWGNGIQRGYGLPNGDKRFSLFNTGRWMGEGKNRPVCCGVVPLLAVHTFDDRKVAEVLESLRVNGSQAAPGFMKPEGVVVFHSATNTLFKRTLDHDAEPKSLVA